jgi:hypothetical protein
MEQITIARGAIGPINQALSSLATKECAVKLAYSIARNISSLQSELEAIQKSYQAPQEMVDLEQTRMGLVKEYAELDDAGEMVIQNSQYLIRPDDRAEFDQKIHEMQVANKDILEDWGEKQKDIQAFLEEEVEVSVHKIDPAWMPEMMTGEIMLALLPLLIENGG